MKISVKLLNQIKAEMNDNNKLVNLLVKYDKGHQCEHNELLEEVNECNEYLNKILKDNE